MTTTGSWIQVSQASGKGETAILIAVEANPSKSRQSTVRIKTEKNEFPVFISQSAVPKLLFSVNGVDFAMILVSGGSFQMGDDKINTPLHPVQLSDYYIAESEVTNELW